jgi:peroxiredoxin
MALSVGTKAPDFTLKRKTADGVEDVNLSKNFGDKNTVLLFFPLAFTGVCTEEMCSVSQGIQSYADLNAEVYAVSVDSPFAQEAWAEKEKKYHSGSQ